MGEMWSCGPQSCTGLRGRVRCRTSFGKPRYLHHKKIGFGLQIFASQARLMGQDGVGQLSGDLGRERP